MQGAINSREQQCWWVRQSAGIRARLGDDADAKVFLELLQEDKGEHCLRNQADPCWDETLIKCQWAQLCSFT